MFNNIDELLAIKEALGDAANVYRRKANEISQPYSEGEIAKEEALRERWRDKARVCEGLIAKMSQAGIG